MTKAIKATCIIGNPYIPSRVHVVGRHLFKSLINAGVDTSIIDIVNLLNTMEMSNSEKRKNALSLETNLLLGADLILVISPIYRASYPGIVKAFFDELPHEALMDKIALPIMVGGTDRHYLAARYTWSVMLQELGAIVPKTVFILDASIDKERDIIVDEVLESLKEPLKISLAIAKALAEI